MSCLSGYLRHWYVCDYCGGWREKCIRVGCEAPNPNAGRKRYLGGGYFEPCRCGPEADRRNR